MRWDAAVDLRRRARAAVRVGGRGVVLERHEGVPRVWRGESLLRAIERWKAGGFFLNGGTDTGAAVRRHFAKHDRVVIVTDEQATWAGGDVDTAVPPTVPVYTWNLAGYRRGHAPSGSGNRHTFGGLTDQAFRMIPLLEAGRNAAWPWEQR